MIIDGHAHACGEFLTSENIIRLLDETGVDKVILVPGELDSTKTYSLPNLAQLFPSSNVVKITNSLTKVVIKLTGAVEEIPPGNAFVYDLVKQTQGRVIQFIWVTEHITNPKKYLSEKFSEWNFKGIKLHQCWDNYSIESEFFMDVAEWAVENNLPLFIHLFSDTDVEDIIKYKRIHPDLKLIVAHLFGLELFIKADYQDDNLYFDTSTVQLVSTKRVIDAIDNFGAAKVTFGTDTPYGKDNLQKNIDRIRSLDISESEKEMILGGNVKRLLNL